jgi:hypothetical protein
MRARSHGVRAWAALFGFVAAYDLWAVLTRHETLSAAFHRGRTGGRGWAVVLGWTYLTLHLLHAIPRRLDPLAVSAANARR